MANVKVSELPAASAASTSQEFEVNDSGTSKKVTGSQIKSFVKDGLVLTDITDVTASITELNYVDGVTSAIQTQLNDKFKQRTITGTTDQITVTNGDGVAGNPTIAAVIASQAEAEAGTDTTKLMTPERTKQAITAQVPASGGMFQLANILTNSGSTATISGLNLTGYKELVFYINGCSPSGNSSTLRLGSIGISPQIDASDNLSGTIRIALDGGQRAISHVAREVSLGGVAQSKAFVSGINTSTTSISFSFTNGNFDTGGIVLWGMK